MKHLPEIVQFKVAYWKHILYCLLLFHHLIPTCAIFLSKKWHICKRGEVKQLSWFPNYFWTKRNVLELKDIQLIEKFSIYYQRIIKTFTRGYREVFCKKGVLKYFAKFLWKQLFRRLLSNKVAIRRLATLLKNRLQHRGFPVNLSQFLRTPIL